MRTYVLAAGDSKRFAEYYGPHYIPKQFIKFQLSPRFKTRQMWENTVAGCSNPGEVYLVTRMDYAHYVESMFRYGRNIFLSERTTGQGDTLYRALQYDNYDGELMVVNCDQGFDIGVLDTLIKQGRTFDKVAALTFRAGPAEHTRWSYVDDHPRFLSVAEKVAISGYALAGAYYFPSAQELRYALLQSVMDAEALKIESYVSHVFARLRGVKKSVEILRSSWYDWGTPEALSRFINEYHSRP